MSSTADPTVLPEFLARAAERWPDAVAVDVPPSASRPNRDTLTYAELKHESELLAGVVHLAVGRGAVAAIMLGRTTPRLYVAQMAVLRAAAAYVCVDPAFPDDQVTHILSDSKARALLTDAAGAERAAQIGYPGPIIRVDLPLTTPALPLPEPPGPDAVAYIIYTSGSTGRPKGVMIPHRGAANLVGGDVREFDLGPGDRVAQGSSPAYDSSVEEIWMALATGATVVSMDDETARLGPDLVPWLRNERITVLCPPPTLLRATGCDDPRTELLHLRLLYVGGEALPNDVAERWSLGRRMVNGYGPTECTVTCMRQDIVPGEPVAIGRPVPGMRAWALDDKLEPVAPGEKGELCMGGAGLAAGYLNQPELTAAKFVEHPKLGRIYRTGDLVHAEPDGTFFYHGRIDSQVKLRGYRIELEAIEAVLARCPGIREAACRVQGEGATEMLAAHVVPVDPRKPPRVDQLKAELRKALPTYMMPGAFGIIEELPRTAGGKLRRSELPILRSQRSRKQGPGSAPTDPIALFIAESVQAVLQLPELPGAQDDFFTDLGGSSLNGAMLITKLRTNPATASITVRDLYETRTVGQLLLRAVPDTGSTGKQRERHAVEVFGATVAQALWLALELFLGSIAAYVGVFWVIPWLSDHIGLTGLIFITPVALSIIRLAITPLSIEVAVRAKKMLIGQYTAVRTPVWSPFHVRIWIVRQFMRFIPWGTIAGTEYTSVVLRKLGARIGERVHIHRGVNLQQGGWDLLDIGDDVTVSQDASLGLVHLEQGQVVIGPVTIDSGATVDIRAGVGPHARVGRNSWLSALSHLSTGSTMPEGERWDGAPARPAGHAQDPPALTVKGMVLSPKAHGLAMIVSRNLVSLVQSLPFAVVAAFVVNKLNLTYDSLLTALSNPLDHLALLTVLGLCACLALVYEVALEAITCRVLGPVQPGVINRYSLGYIRVWLKTGLVDSAGKWLSGGIFWPVWLRAAGMSLGPDCEISTIIDVVPELIRIDGDTFFADGIYLGGPRVQRGTVTLTEVSLGTNTFLGNHAVIAAGQRLPSDILIGISTVADDRLVRPGTSWFGHPPFELPQREIVSVDRSLTHEPSLIRVINRNFWEWLRFTLPIVPLIAVSLWTYGVEKADEYLDVPALLLLGVPAVSFLTGAFLCLVILVMKWGLLGRVREGIHPLWSCWASRWDFLYVAWGFIAGKPLSALEGTLLLPIYLRWIGVKIGKRVALGEGFAQIVDPDMLEFGDGSTVNAMFQAHTFEDRVLKIGHVKVGAHSTLGDATVPLYGAVVGEHTTVAPHSVIMKHEHLLPGLRYEGAPTRRRGDEEAEPVGIGRHELEGPLWTVQPVLVGVARHRIPRAKPNKSAQR
ncbi:non-ribosomal peptide synthetase [Kutzneria sp. CA-103260]|uniref:non-ribosomal peptide synthetase n=1 Tax=Kutzneria sp. CA-103260 TaxID=2802641 RepID=UPI001BA4478C|nr:non-ribosomal peptide synthetase [Kutzneria sp. CA-103260]QUQ72196.1 amino acid adenylation domain-containing protein [Kutzneria sp. CA-103260]